MHDHIPSEAETIAQWESVLRQDARICRKKMTVFAKVADEDGTLTGIMEREQQEAIDVQISQNEDEAGVAMVPLRSGGGAAPDANASGGGDTSAVLPGDASSGLWGAGWLMCVEPPPPGHAEAEGSVADNATEPAVEDGSTLTTTLQANFDELARLAILAGATRSEVSRLALALSKQLSQAASDES